MSEKKPWHDPKFIVLDAAATAGDPGGTPDDPGHLTTDDSTADNPVTTHDPGAFNGGVAPDNVDPNGS